MQTFSIEVSDKNDAQLILMLVQRLGLKFKQVEKNGVSKSQKKDLEYHRKIIEAGVAIPKERLHEILKSIDEGRQDREMPFRES